MLHGQRRLREPRRWITKLVIAVGLLTMLAADQPASSMSAKQALTRLQGFVGDWNRLYKTLPALFANDFKADGFAWIQCDDSQNSVFAFERTDRGSEHTAIAICNFTPVPRENYRVGIPAAGGYQLLLNSDARCFGGGDCC